MGSIAQFKADYLTASPPVLPPGERFQLAGALKAIELLNERGMSIPTAGNTVAYARMNRIVHRAQMRSNPFQANLVSDYRGISAP